MRTPSQIPGLRTGTIFIKVGKAKGGDIIKVLLDPLRVPRPADNMEPINHQTTLLQGGASAEAGLDLLAISILPVQGGIEVL